MAILRSPRRLIRPILPVKTYDDSDGLATPDHAALPSNCLTTPRVQKPADCKGDCRTTIDEVPCAVNRFWEVSLVQSRCDLNGDGQVSIDEI